MIGESVENAQALYDRIHEVLPWKEKSQETKDFCVELMQTITDKSFPGGIIPSIGKEKNLILNILANNQTEWRIIRPIILAFAGPTITSFDGVPIQIDAYDPLRNEIFETNARVKTLISLPSEHRQLKTSLSAISRLVKSLKKAPDLNKAIPVPTSWLLSNLQDSLNVGDKSGALLILDRLKTELRLDAINLKFLEIEIFYTFREWQKIINMPKFSDLCKVRKTPQNARHIMTALYEFYLGVAFEQRNFNQLKETYLEKVRHHSLNMYEEVLVEHLDNFGLRIVALEHIIFPNNTQNLVPLLKRNMSSLGWISEELKLYEEKKDSDENDTVYGNLDPIKEKFFSLERSDSIKVLSQVIESLKDLSDRDKETLSQFDPFKKIFSSTEKDLNFIPTNWIEWFKEIKNEGFVNSHKIAKSGSNEWRVEEDLDDENFVIQLEKQIEESFSDSVAEERVSFALPNLVFWLQRDSQFPRTTLKKLYSDIFSIFVISSNRHKSAFDSCFLLIAGILGIGLKTNEYENLLGEINELIGKELSINNIYWVLEVSEEIIRNNCPSEGSRRSFLEEVVSKIHPQLRRLSKLQLTNLKLLASELSWPISGEISELLENSSPEDPLKIMDKMNIGIYSLMESATSKAKEILQISAPNSRVECNNDRAGTDKLKALARNSDIVVITWLAATHAATNFINIHRGDRPIIYSKGKGFSSIIRAIEEYAANKVQS